MAGVLIGVLIGVFPGVFLGAGLGAPIAVEHPLKVNGYLRGQDTVEVGLNHWVGGGHQRADALSCGHV